MDPLKNDLVELDYGSKLIEIAKIIHVSNEDSEVIAFNIISKEKIILKKQDLYLKEEISERGICESYRKQMNMLGASNIWVRLNKSQYKKILKEKKEYHSSVEEIDDKQIDKLKKWFLENKEEDKKEIFLNIFNSKKLKEIEENTINIFKEIGGPLSRFIKKNI
jgi:hypothetical protein